jgi:hypothetical protein
VTKERRDVLPLVETKRSISFLWGCVDGNILAPESLAAKPERFSCELRDNERGVICAADKRASKIRRGLAEEKFCR